MSLYNPEVSILAFPHLLSKVEIEKKRKYRERYKNFKISAVAGSLSLITVSEGLGFAKDIVSSKLKAYGYKSLFAICAGPLIQFISIPLYIFSYATKLQKTAVTIAQLGALITETEVSMVNWAFFAMDVCVFGEAVPIVEQHDLCWLRNETASELVSVFPTLLENNE